MLRTLSFRRAGRAGTATRAFLAVFIALLLMLPPGGVRAQPLPGVAGSEIVVGEDPASDNPLQPLDVASPRGTLLGFLANGDAVGRLYRDIYHDAPTVANLRAVVLTRLRAARRVMDLSDVPPAIRDRTALDAAVHLYEVLSRIDLPPADAIPGPAEAAAAPARWAVPHTDIVLLRMADGPRRGDWLFSADTVARAAEMYGLVRDRPYRRTVPTGDFVEIRRLIGGVGVPPRAIEALPAWARADVLGLVVWKWIALGVLAAALAAGFAAARRAIARGRDRAAGRPVASALLRLALPAVLIVLALLASAVANGVVNVAETLGSPVRLAAEAVIHLAGAWIAWVAAASVAEIAIASPRIAEGTLDAQLLRLSSRLVGAVLAVTLILVGGEEVGLPLIGLVAGVGIGGLAIALAAQDTLRNVLGSLMIFFDQPYRAGDRIVVLGHDGIVEQIGLRSTRIRLLDGQLMTIPNEKMASAEIANVSQRPSIQRIIRLGLTYGTAPAKVERAIAVLREILDGHAASWAQPPRIHFAEFAPDSLTLTAYTWYQPAVYWDYADAHGRINLEILRRFGEEGIEFAFPTTTMLLEPGSGPIKVELGQPAAEGGLRTSA